MWLHLTFAGSRRLNVLFTRAKQKIGTFSSMTAADILADEAGNPGVYMLKRWLEYSKTGVLEAGVVTKREPDSEFEVYVMNQIQAMGCQPVPQAGVAGYFIDIGVKHPEWPHGYVLGVDDGANYHSAKSARDRDRLRQEVLEGLGWHLHRIWLTAWFTSNTGVSIGDTVRVKYLADGGKELKVKISREKSDPSNGIVYYETPLAKALLGAEEGDEVNVLIGNQVRAAKIEEIISRYRG
jgi:transcription elongation GreA/GreB family factor